MEQIETKLSGITTKLKEIKQKYESSSKELKTASLDKHLYDDLVGSIESIELLLANKQMNLKRLDTSRLNEIEQLYVDKETELGFKIDLEIEKYEREKAIELMKERQAREARLARENVFLKEINRLSDSVGEARDNGMSLINRVKSKIDAVKRIDSATRFVTDLTDLCASIETNLDKIKGLNERLKALVDPNKLSDDDLDRTSTNISSIMVQCLAKQNDHLSKMKQIEAEIQQHIDGILKVSNFMRY